MMKKAIRIVAGNSAIALIPALIYYWFGRDVTPPRLFEELAASFIFSNCIGCLAHWILPLTWGSCKRAGRTFEWPARFLLLFAIAVAGSLIASGILLSIGWATWNDFWPTFRNSLKIATLLTLVFGGGTAVYSSLRAQLEATTLELRTNELKCERALKLATEAQLASLESRIHPHFLFNALNSISSLIPEDPQRAERLIERMAALLRFSLDSKQRGLVPLEREMKIVADYLEIEKARFGDRLRYQIDISGGVERATTPPLSVQTLVENSVKYAISPRRERGEIRVTAGNDGGKLRVAVWDDGPGFRMESVEAGHGLNNLEERLQMLFGSEARLEVCRAGGGTLVSFTIPQEPAAAEAPRATGT